MTTMDQPTLHTERLILRPFTLADADNVQRLASAWEVADTTLNIPHPYPDGAAAQWIGTHPANFEAGTSVTFAIVLRDSNTLCGAIGLGIHRKHVRAEMGYWLGVPFWNGGIVTEAARGVLRYGFDTLNLHRIYAFHFARNPASGRVMQKIGMRYEGTLRHHDRKDDHWEDLVSYGILADEWRASVAQ
jgi:RimJ/RimL family protein N-acetyltransferase